MNKEEKFYTRVGLFATALISAFAGILGGYRAGYESGKEDTTPIYGERRDIDHDGVEDLILTNSKKENEVLFGVHENLRKNLSENKPYVSREIFERAVKSKLKLKEKGEMDITGEFYKRLTESLDSTEEEKVETKFYEGQVPGFNGFVRVSIRNFPSSSKNYFKRAVHLNDKNIVYTFIDKEGDGITDEIEKKYLSEDFSLTDKTPAQYFRRGDEAFQDYESLEKRILQFIEEGKLKEVKSLEDK